MNKPILYGSATCLPCLEVCDFINEHRLAVDNRWVLPRMDATYLRYHVVIATGARVDDLIGVPTLVDGDRVIRGSTDIIAYLTNKYKSS